MKKRLFFYTLIALLAACVTAGGVTYAFSSASYRDELTKQSFATIDIIRSQVEQLRENGVEPDYEKLAAGYPDELRVTFIRPDGRVAGDSAVNAETMENHLLRHEVQQALAAGQGVEMRKSASLGVQSIYAAKYDGELGLIIRVSAPMARLTDYRGYLIRYIAAGGLCAFLVAALLLFLFYQKILQPVSRLTQAAKEIAQGDYGREIETDGRGEIGELSAAFNSMSRQVQKAVADQKLQNLKLNTVVNSVPDGIISLSAESRVELLNPAGRLLLNLPAGDPAGLALPQLIRNSRILELVEECLKTGRAVSGEVMPRYDAEAIYTVYVSPMIRQREEGEPQGCVLIVHDDTQVKKLEKMRSQFVSNVTHELKTPLTSIRGFVETLKEGAMDDPAVAQDFLTIIDLEAQRLSMLISDILELSEIETASAAEFGRERFSAKELVDEVEALLRPVAQERKVTLYGPENDFMLTASRDKMKQMLINLLDNGIKYNQEGGEVRVSLEIDGLENRLIVKDTGIGIPKEHLERVFERFYRVDKGRSRSMGGTGLGLSIVKHIVGLYHGRIDVQSTPGEGTAFTVSFPSEEK